MPPSQPTASRAATALAVALSLALLVVVVRCAWVSDDAFVTLRTVRNLVEGHGLRFNVLERVQAYTHPAWMALLATAFAVTREPWLTTMAVGVAVSAAAVGALVANAGSRWATTLALGSLLASKAWVDFATSGLENPLTNLCLAGFVWALHRDRVEHRPAPVFAWAALLGACRLDDLLLVGPALAVLAVRSLRERRLGALAAAQLGWAPLLAWHLFALVYYGDPLPNTFHAKLGTGLPLAETLPHGLAWWAWNLRVDWLTPSLLVVGCAAGAWSRDLRSLALVCGVLVHLGYVTCIGGDFMAGRFLVAPLVVALAIAVRRPWGPAGGLFAVAAVLGSLLSPFAPLRSGPAYQKAPAKDGVVDERGYYWRGTGLFAEGQRGWQPTHDFARDGRAARGAYASKAVIGLYGYYAPVEHHVIDRLGLSDPLLARLPAIDDPAWRIGHHQRVLPAGLAAAELAGRPVDDPDVRALHADVLAATRAPLFEPERWAAIVRLTTGRPTFPERFVRPDLVELPSPPTGPIAVKPGGVRWTLPAATTVELDGGRRWHLRIGADLDTRLVDPGVVTLGPGTTIFLPEQPGTLRVVPSGGG